MKRLLAFMNARRFACAVTLVAVAVLIAMAFRLDYRTLPMGVIVGMTWLTDDVLVLKLLASRGLADSTYGVLTPKHAVIAKTADYTVLGTEPCGTTFTTRGAGAAVNFTLPAPKPQSAGLWYEFLNLVDQNMTVTAGTADTLIVDGDLTADSLAVSTASHKIGAVIRVFCDGTAWIANGQNVGATFTVAT